MMKQTKLFITLLTLALFLSAGYSSMGQTSKNNDVVITELPHFEDFSGVTLPDLPAGWEKVVDNPGLGSARVATTEDNDPFSEPYHGEIRSNAYDDQTMMLITPLVEGIQQTRVSFRAKANSTTNIPDLIIGTMTNAADTTTFVPYDTIPADNMSDAYDQQFAVQFDDSVDDNSHIAFLHGGSPNFIRTLFIDDVLIMETPDEPILLVNPESHDFGTYAMEDTSDPENFTISNIGIGTITIDPEDIHITGADADRFILDNIDGTIHLETFDIEEVSVAFAPQIPGTKNATLHIAEMEIPLTGESVDPTITSFPHFEDFSNVDIPELPLGWGKIVDNPDLSSARVETSSGSPYSEPYHAEIRSNDHEPQHVMLITPPVEDIQGKRIRFQASVSSSSNIPDLIVGTMSDPESAATFTPIHTIEADTELTDDYNEFQVVFDDAVGDDEYIALKHGGTPSWSRNIYIDDFLLEVMPTTPVLEVTPESHHFAATQIAATSFPADFVIINEGVGELTVEPEDISLTGADAGSFILHNLTETINLGAFETDTIQIEFAPESVGNKEAVVEIQEVEVPVTGEAFDATITEFPYLQDFENVEIPELPYGWSSIADNPDLSSVRVETIDSDDPLSDPFHVEMRSNDYDDQHVMLVTPPIDNLNEQRVRFWAKCDRTTNVPDLIVGTMADPSDKFSFTALDTIPYEQLTDSYEEEFIISFDSYTGEDIFVAFKHGGSQSFTRTLYMDDILVETIPDEPILVVSHDDHDFDMQQIGTTSEFETITILNDGVGTLTIGPDDISITGSDAAYFTLDNLEEEVHLEAQEEAFIGVAFSPESTGNKTATLEVDDEQITLTGEAFDATITELPFFENFTDAEVPHLPLGWSSIVDNPDLSNARVETTSSDDPYSGSYHAEIRSNDYEEQDVMMILPPVGMDVENLRISFQAKINLSTNKPDLIVGTMSQITDATTFTPADTIYAEEMSDSYEGQFTIYFDDANEGDEYIAFKHGGTPSWTRSILIDEILLEEVEDEPSMVITPDELDFGAQQIGLTSDFEEFTILNDGGGTLTVAPEDIEITGSDATDFTLNNLDETVDLGAGESAVISVAFAPEVVGNKTATLEIIDEEITITGEAFDATVTDFPWTEDFLEDWTGDPASPEGWTVVNGIDGSYWEQSGGASYTGDYSARSYNGFGSDNQADEWLITPPIDLDEIEDPLLSFFGYISQSPDGVRENVRVLVLDQPHDNTDDLHANATLLDVKSFSDEWTEFIIDIQHMSGEKYFAFNYFIEEEDDASFGWVYVDNVTIDSAPEEYTVTFTVTDDSEEEDPVEGATIEVGNMDPVHTDATGTATMELIDGSYSASVHQEGYEMAETDFTVDGAPLDVSVTLVQNVFTLTLATNPQEGGSVTGEGDYEADEEVTVEATAADNYLFVNWTDADGQEVSQDPVHTFDMPWEDKALTANFEVEVHLVSFVVSEDSDDETPVENATIAIEDVGDLQTDEDGEASIELENGAYSAIISKNGYEDTQVPFVVDGVDKTIDVLLTDIIHEPYDLTVTTEDLGDGEALFTWAHQESEKIFTGFTVYLNDDVVATDITETEHLFTELPDGTHTAGVQAIYTTGESEVETIDFEMITTYTVSFNIIDEEGDPLEDAVITFDGETHAAGTYVFEEIEAGTYGYTVEKEGYYTADGEVTVEEDITVDVTLEEIIETHEVTFYADISYAIEFGLLEGFDPEEHHIMITGEMTGWEEPDTDGETVMELVETEPMTYAITLTLEEGAYEYKYFSDLLGEGWQGGEWEGGDDRHVDVTEDMTVEDMFGYRDDETGLDSPESLTLNVYPNPANERLTIESDESISDIRMINMLGQVVYSATVSDNRHQINVSGMQQGVYFIQVGTSAGITTHRVQVTD